MKRRASEQDFSPPSGKEPRCAAPALSSTLPSTNLCQFNSISTPPSHFVNLAKPLVISWLRANYEVGQDNIMVKAQLFEEYQQACFYQRLQPLLSAPAFGRIVHKAFPGIKSCRIGHRITAKHCYKGLSRRTEPLAYVTLCPTRSICPLHNSAPVLQNKAVIACHSKTEAAEKTKQGPVPSQTSTNAFFVPFSPSQSVPSQHLCYLHSHSAVPAHHASSASEDHIALPFLSLSPPSSSSPIASPGCSQSPSRQAAVSSVSSPQDPSLHTDALHSLDNFLATTASFHTEDTDKNGLDEEWISWFHFEVAENMANGHTCPHASHSSSSNTNTKNETAHKAHELRPLASPVKLSTTAAAVAAATTAAMVDELMMMPADVNDDLSLQIESVKRQLKLHEQVYTKQVLKPHLDECRDHQLAAETTTTTTTTAGSDGGGRALVYNEETEESCCNHPVCWEDLASHHYHHQQQHDHHYHYHHHHEQQQQQHYGHHHHHDQLAQNSDSLSIFYDLPYIHDAGPYTA